MDRLRRVANVSKFAQLTPILAHCVGDGSVIETQCILIQDPVATILQCKGVPFLAIAQVNSIKVDGSPQTYVDKEMLPEKTVLVGVQILSLKPANVQLLDGKEGDWVWECGNDASLIVPGKYLQQISPELVLEHGGTLPSPTAYGFRSDELRDLATTMFQGLTPEDVRGLIETQLTESFPYKIEGKHSQTGKKNL
ncbi:uncharacterized protein EI90DRAFT_3124860 [Cantharellus anzutake]|uniref:uncharacterized protein n=1 Tax=Cantharellus anzutake TaxID=1750568 RepID=UPI001903FA06|nr:uncharacterized protein EI90DRAFT_3124860 [Cantharellus anzutake]KAF8330042.1 hypothetical protein EI90DRAFT_3124860 [Cantharellus anzutake]